jgi:1-deoxy-D-xylulose-5-phosphate synthase
VACLDDLPTADVLDCINSPADLKALSGAECARLAAEIRTFIVEAVSRTGGHLGSNLGAVELTIALHRVFDSPADFLLFDTGHQAYVHKLLTGRRDGFAGLKQEGGLSGYPNRAESVHDHIENSHASTALSWAHGLAKSLELSGEGSSRRVVAVVGDGALTGGMAYEALNNIGHAGAKVLIVLNDNGRSYAPTVSRLSESLTQLRLNPSYTHWRERLRGVVRDVPGVGRLAYASIHGLTAALREIVEPHVFFEALGVRYTGPLDGHDIAAIEHALRNAAAWEGPIVLHVLTTKGKGFGPAEEDEVQCLHDFKVAASVTAPGASTDAGAVPAPGESPSPQESFTDAFSAAIIAAGERDDKLVAVTAAMPGPTGLLGFEARYPERFVDVGIAEAHAVGAAAGMALGGLHPVVAVYSTFFSRAFDQANLDVGLHGAPVVFCLDRAGVTGDDGPSHHGLVDLVLALSIPGVSVFCPSVAADIAPMLAAALELRAPCVIRWPKTPSVVETLPPVGPLSARRLVTGDGSLVLIGIGKLAHATRRAAEILAGDAVQATVYDPRLIRPADEEMLGCAAAAELVVTVEDGLAAGGAGAYLQAEIARTARRQGRPVPEALVLGLETAYFPHAKPDRILARAGLDADGIAASVSAALGQLRATRREGRSFDEVMGIES